MYRLALIIAMLSAVQAEAQISPDDFISDFESGNITNVRQSGLDSFTVEIRLDDIHGDTYGWYYFAITGNQGRTATIFLTNPDGWQSSSCRPVVSADNINWGRVANVWGENGWLCFRQFLGADTVWFAQGFPYTVSGMYSYLDSLELSPFVDRNTLGYSVHNRPIDMVSITDESIPLERKKTAWLISRQHPMESGPTYTITGLMDRILDDDLFARYFLKDIELKIVPIVNVDGVAEGYSRHSVNGINLNRDWREDIENEQPEVYAVHTAINDFINSGNNIDLFMDLHSAPDNYDFGFRISLAYSDQHYFENQGTFLHLLETYDSWQDQSRWRDLDPGYANGVSCVILYDMYDLDCFSSESPWTKRENGEFITKQSLYNQGEPLAHAIYDYLFPLEICDNDEVRIDSLVPGRSFLPIVTDYDQRNQGAVYVDVVCPATSDSERVICYRRDFEGVFAPFHTVPTDLEQPVPGDGVVSVVPGSEIVAEYVEPEIPDRVCRRYIAVEGELDVVDKTPLIPDSYMSAYPNPFNSSTTISYENYPDGKICIFDIMGREIRSFDIAGDGAIVWDARDENGNSMVSGIYFVAAGSGESRTIKLVYLK